MTKSDVDVGVTVIVPARDAADTLGATLAGLENQHLDEPFEVIVVDDASHDQTADLAQRSPVVNRVLRREQGEGAGAARNAGAAQARGSRLAFLDADCRPGPGWLAGGLRALEQADLVQGRVLPDASRWVGPFDRTLSIGQPTGLYETANLFVRRDLFERLGGFSTGLERRRAGRAGAPFGEDAMFGWAARRAGARTAFCPEALVYHEVTARGPDGFIAERLRLAMFPALAAAVPELRDGFLHRRIFISKRSARFDLAVVGGLSALGTRQPTLLVVAAPYLLTAARSARVWGVRRAPAVLLAEVVADAVGAAALLRGSVRARSLVI